MEEKHDSMIGSMKGKVKKTADALTEGALTGFDRFYQGVTDVAEAAVNKTKEAARDANEVKEKFKKVDVRDPLK